MESAIDLPELGRRLRARREALDLTREELSNRVGVTPTYIFLVEGAKPRQTGTPSRPKRETLRRWIEALGWTGEEENQILALAGYPPVEHRDQMAPVSFAAHAFSVPPMAAAPAAIPPPPPAAASMLPAEGEDWDETQRETLHLTLDAVLDLAERQGDLPTIATTLQRVISDLGRRLRRR
jgi:transcriptional regulator with XRE-family HTH domain